MVLAGAHVRDSADDHCGRTRHVGGVHRAPPLHLNGGGVAEELPDILIGPRFAASDDLFARRYGLDLRHWRIGTGILGYGWQRSLNGWLDQVGPRPVEDEHCRRLKEL